MEYNGDLFIKKFPKLTNTQMVDYFKKYESGDMSARDAIIYHNIIVVISRVVKVFYSFPFDKKDLVSIGIQGLIKAVDTFDSSKNNKFATYATRCITNEILMFIRSEKKYINDRSLQETIYESNGDYKETSLSDILSDDVDISLEYEKKEEYKTIRELVNELPDRDKKIIMLKYGFIDDRCYTQLEIASILNISQSYISRLINKINKKLGKDLEQYGVLQHNSFDVSKQVCDKKNVTKGDKTCNEVRESNNNEFSIVDNAKENSEELLEMLKKSGFINMLLCLSPKEAIIVMLQLGFIDKKRFSSLQIASFFDIGVQEVDNITLKILQMYTNNINKNVDKLYKMIK